MKDQVVSFETAKLAEEKGFFQEITRRKQYYNHKGELNGDVKDLVRAMVNKDDSDKYDCISAPTQSLLQKWLREVKGIKVIADTNLTLMWIYTIQSLHPQASYTGDFIISESVYGTYEDALEAGLREALKLI